MTMPNPSFTKKWDLLGPALAEVYLETGSWKEAAMWVKLQTDITEE